MTYALYSPFQENGSAYRGCNSVKNDKSLIWKERIFSFWSLVFSFQVEPISKVTPKGRNLVSCFPWKTVIVSNPHKSATFLSMLLKHSWLLVHRHHQTVNMYNICTAMLKFGGSISSTSVVTWPIFVIIHPENRNKTNSDMWHTRNYWPAIPEYKYQLTFSFLTTQLIFA